MRYYAFCCKTLTYTIELDADNKEQAKEMITKDSYDILTHEDRRLDMKILDEDELDKIIQSGKNITLKDL